MFAWLWRVMKGYEGSIFRVDIVCKMIVCGQQSNHFSSIDSSSMGSRFAMKLVFFLGTIPISQISFFVGFWFNKFKTAMKQLEMASFCHGECCFVFQIYENKTYFWLIEITIKKDLTIFLEWEWMCHIRWIILIKNDF